MDIPTTGTAPPLACAISPPAQAGAAGAPMAGVFAGLLAVAMLADNAEDAPGAGPGPGSGPGAEADAPTPTGQEAMPEPGSLLSLMLPTIPAEPPQASSAWPSPPAPVSEAVAEGGEALSGAPPEIGPATGLATGPATGPGVALPADPAIAPAVAQPGQGASPIPDPVRPPPAAAPEPPAAGRVVALEAALRGAREASAAMPSGTTAPQALLVEPSAAAGPEVASPVEPMAPRAEPAAPALAVPAAAMRAGTTPTTAPALAVPPAPTPEGADPLAAPSLTAPSATIPTGAIAAAASPPVDQTILVAAALPSAAPAAQAAPVTAAQAAPGAAMRAKAAPIAAPRVEATSAPATGEPIPLMPEVAATAGEAVTLPGPEQALPAQPEPPVLADAGSIAFRPDASPAPEGREPRLERTPLELLAAAPTPAGPSLSAPQPMPAVARAFTPFVLPSRQIAPFAIALAMGADASMTVTLDPIELGRVEVSIERNGTEAAIRVVAERPETLALLQRDARELERALAGAGMGGEGTSLSFSLGGGDASRDPSRQPAARRAVFAPAAAATSLVNTNPDQQSALRRGLLDLAV